MQRVASFVFGRRKRRPSSFTLIEMLTVIAIIAILAAITLGTGSAILNASKRSRAKAEITAMSSAMENYKIDNGSYTNAAYLTIPYALDPQVANASAYQSAAAALFSALSGGKTNYTAAATANTKVYYNFSTSQVGNPSGQSYVQDPWGYSYGYSTGASGTSNTYNGVGFFDIWSTGGSTTSTNGWIGNWNN